jgi:hypothetical protein
MVKVPLTNTTPPFSGDEAFTVTFANVKVGDSVYVPGCITTLVQLPVTVENALVIVLNGFIIAPEPESFPDTLDTCISLSYRGLDTNDAVRAFDADIALLADVANEAEPNNEPVILPVTISEPDMITF